MLPDIRPTGSVFGATPLIGPSAREAPRPFWFGVLGTSAVSSVALLTSVGMAAAQTPQSSDVFQSTISVLLKLFVAALLLESGLNALFTWRVFLVLFDGRGWKTLIMVAASWLLVKTVHINWLADLFNTYSGHADTLQPNTGIQFLTALVLAGGSNGIYNILLRLGYRAPVSLEPIQQKLQPDKAWISVEVTRGSAVGSIKVHLDRLDPQPTPLPLAIAGVVGVGGWKDAVRGLFFHDRMRFPQSAGYALDPGVAYRLELAATSAGGSAIACRVDGVYVLARGAIVDLKVTL